MQQIQTATDLRNAIRSRYKTNREFMEAFKQAGGTVDETVLSRQLNGSRGLSSAWLSAYNIFFSQLDRKEHQKITTMKSRFFIQIVGVRNEMQPEEYKSEKKALSAWEAAEARLGGLGEKVIAWEEKPDGKCIDLITGEEIK